MRRFPIRAKMLAYTLIIVLGLGGSLAVTQVISESERILTTFTNSAKKTSQFISNSIRDQIEAQNIEAIQEILSSADVNPNIDSIRVTDRVGLPLYSWKRGEGVSTDKKRISHRSLDAIMDSRGWVVYQEGELLQIGGVMQKGEEDVFGYILVTFSLEDITSFIRASAMSSVTITSLFMLITALMAVLLSDRAIGGLQALSAATQQLARGDYSVRVNVRSRDEIGDLANSFNAMAEEVSRLTDEQVEKARMESELKAAQQVQASIFPPESAQLGPVGVCGYYRAASECGGDWWHYHETDNKVYFWMGDATGHGVPAALITSVAKTVAMVVERIGEPEPKEVMGLLNRVIAEASEGKIFMTFFLCAMDKATGVVRYSLASHDPPYKIPRVFSDLKRGDLHPIFEPNNGRLGAVARPAAFSEGEFVLDKGESLFVFTDGLADYMGGSSHLERYIARNLPNKASPGQFVRNLGKEIDDKIDAGFEMVDDVTFCMIHRIDA